METRRLLIRCTLSDHTFSDQCRSREEYFKFTFFPSFLFFVLFRALLCFCNCACVGLHKILESDEGRRRRRRRRRRTERWKKYSVTVIATLPWLLDCNCRPFRKASFTGSRHTPPHPPISLPRPPPPPPFFPQLPALPFHPSRKRKRKKKKKANVPSV